MSDYWDKAGWTTDLQTLESFTPGAVIRFETRVYDYRRDQTDTVLKVGTIQRIVQLDHPCTPGTEVYYETTGGRVWPLRDNPTTGADVELELGAAPAGALF